MPALRAAGPSARLPTAVAGYGPSTEGAYRILVKVIDIFGNDTSQAFDVEVK
jgi:hypothetical protein